MSFDGREETAHLPDLLGDAYASEPSTPGPPSLYGKLPNVKAKGRNKFIQDDVHGLMSLSAAACAVMDTRPMQRLRGIKQLGATSYVYPSACHTRFEHSLGVGFLSQEYGRQVKVEQPELELNDDDIAALAIAGEIHDWGHGPFSHTWDKGFLPAVGIFDQPHEEKSVRLFEYMLDQGVLEGVDLRDPDAVGKKVVDMVRAGEKNWPHRGWLFSIVANGTNGLDTDKFDYLQRDSRNCGITCWPDFPRILKSSRVIDGEICYNWNEYRSVLGIYNFRAHMHNTVYMHPKVRAVDRMITDAMVLADPLLGLKEKSCLAASGEDPTPFLSLNDSVLDTIQNYDIKHAEDGSESMLKAQQILRRLDGHRRPDGRWGRDLYKFVGEALIPPDRYPSFSPPKPADLVGKGPAGKLREEDIVVDLMRVDYTSGNQNPLDTVKFFDWNNPDEKYTIASQHVTWSVPQSWEERRVRVYSKDSRPEVVANLTAAFRKWTADTFRGEVMTTPPARTPPAALRPGAGSASLVARNLNATPEFQV